MSELFLLVLGLSGIAAVFLLVLPAVWSREVDGDSVDDWLAIRQKETDDEALMADAQLRVWDDKEIDTAGPAVMGASVSWPYQIVLLLALTAATWVLYDRLGAYEDVQITRAIVDLEAASPEEVNELVQRIESRSKDRPDNLDYRSLLGEYYISTGRAEDALDNYEAILAEAPESPDVLGRAAQAEFIINEQTLTPRARLRAERALASDPTQQSALATLSMGAFGAGNFVEAIGYMRVLRDLEVPGSQGYELMRTAIAEAESRIASGPEVGGESEMVAGVSGPSLEIEVDVEGTLAASDYIGNTVFVIARPAGSSQRMPTAVVRHQLSGWPFAVMLSDENSMAGQVLSDLEEVDIEVQVSKNGQPGLSNAVLRGEIRGVALADSPRLYLCLNPAPR